ncbi:hypothetical protein AALP_AA4G111900 [Arabis alpina]|uniref:Uncharacterized protein n=1 Tax=Arabis alpina TaxID=50452 RepID=A0A087H2J9_ARAAL|nr:hypothetical protein AALP_AA4G111900 [Arabis alpina]
MREKPSPRSLMFYGLMNWGNYVLMSSVAKSKVTIYLSQEHKNCQFLCLGRQKEEWKRKEDETEEMKSGFIKKIRY